MSLLRSKAETYRVCGSENQLRSVFQTMSIHLKRSAVEHFVPCRYECVYSPPISVGLQYTTLSTCLFFPWVLKFLSWLKCSSRIFVTWIHLWLTTYTFTLELHEFFWLKSVKKNSWRLQLPLSVNWNRRVRQRLSSNWMIKGYCVVSSSSSAYAQNIRRFHHWDAGLWHKDAVINDTLTLVQNVLSTHLKHLAVISSSSSTSK